MDFSKFKTHDWLVVGGGIGVLICGFLPWIKVEADVGGVSFGSASQNAFGFFFTGTLPWLLIVGAAIATVLLMQGVLQKEQLPWPLVILGATGLAALLLLIRVIFNPIEGSDATGGLIEAKRGIGMILSAVAGLAAAAGGVMSFTASGGDLSDLKDPNKLKAAFSNDGGDTPPPPPPM